MNMNTNTNTNTGMNTNTQPAMLSSKNLGILEDQLNYEALCNKKISLYTNYFVDPNLKNVCQKAAQMHKQHFDMLFNYLNSHNKPQQQQ
jgi:hypothetical protein